MDKCPRCGRPTSYRICEQCESELSIKTARESDYNKRLHDGFAMLQADENPSEYNEIWD